MQWKSQAVEEGCPVDRYTPLGRPVHSGMWIGNNKLIPGGRTYFSSKASLFRGHTTLG